MNNSKIKYSRKQSLKVVDNCNSKRKVSFAESVEKLQEKLLSKRNKSNSSNNKNDQRRKSSLSEKCHTEECKTVLTPKNISKDKISFSDKRKSEIINRLNLNTRLQIIQENEQENGNTKIIDKLALNNYILYDNICEKKTNFRDGLQNVVKNEHRRSIYSILGDNKKTKDINSERKSIINNKTIDETKTNIQTPLKLLSKPLINTIINPDISREDNFQKIKKKYLSPFIFSTRFPTVTLKNKYFNNYIIDTTNIKSNRNFIDNDITSINRSNAQKDNNEPTFEDETAEFIQKNENIFSNQFSFSNKKDLLNESSNRCYDNIMNTIDKKINEINRHRDCSTDIKRINNIFKIRNIRNVSSMQRELINKINTMKTSHRGKKDYFSKVFCNYNINLRNSNKSHSYNLYRSTRNK